MIDTPTAWSILCTPLGIAAGLGWIRCARMLAKAHKALKIARDGEAYWRSCHAGAFHDLAIARSEAITVTAERDKCKLRAEQYASSWGRVMRLLRIAEGELKTFRTAQLRQEQAERMDAAADRIAA